MKVFPRIFATALILSLAACATEKYPPINPSEPITTFNNDSWAYVLNQIVTPDGYVQWDQLQNNTNGVRDQLLAYIGLISQVSPDNRPELFPTNSDQQAYWINTYNALCIYWVICHDCASSVSPFRPDLFKVGQQEMLIPDIAQKAWQSNPDPRIYFALNCCAHSSPPLRPNPYNGPALQAQLADQGHLYLRDPRAAQRQNETVLLNDIILTHRDAFITAIPNSSSDPDPALLSSLRYMSTENSPIAWATQIGSLGFDSSLNRPPQ
jgi:hypothetical protein